MGGAVPSHQGRARLRTNLVRGGAGAPRHRSAARPHV